MKIERLLLILLVVVGGSSAACAQGLKDAVGKYCLIGTALNQWQSDGQDAAASAVVRQHFNAAVAENCMKSECLQPAEGIFDFRVADKFVGYCRQNNLKIIGHCLVWHSQAPDWMFTDGYCARPASKEVLRERIINHIRTVVGHYKGQIHGWDVVNEAIEDDGSFRKSPFYNLLGEEFIELAFRTAHEADPDAELYYNDYSMANPGKREAVCRLVKRLKEKGLRIDGVGMQSHNGMNYPDLTEYEKSIDAFAACGVKVMITELDLNVLPNPQQFGGADISQNFEYQQKLNPYIAGLPKDKAKEVEQCYLELFKIYYRHRDQISRINLWGIADHNSWLNDWPVKGRTNYPLLFDRQYQPKPIVNEIIKLYQ
ncbi:MAG: endo-1,4-beta-xylanase [Prevotella sp.]|nr:endo-1,4-beta-xylanase [Prevotella sp.]